MIKILNVLFSNKLSGLLLIVFAASMAVATFIENDFGTETARTLIYNATWFEIVLLLLSFNFIGNIYKYKLFSIQKAPILVFHIAFIVIILGAGITRYRGYEAMMSIDENSESNVLVSYDSYLSTSVGDGHFYKNFNPHKLALSELGSNELHQKYEFEDKEVKLHVKKYIPRAVSKLVDKPNGDTYLHAVLSVLGQRKDFYIKKGSWEVINGLSFSFDNNKKADFNITQEDQNVKVEITKNTNYFTMATSERGSISKDSIHDLKFRTLYTVGSENVVFLNIYDSSALIVEESERVSSDKGVESALIVDVSVNNGEKREVVLTGGRGFINPAKEMFFDDIYLKLNYGSKRMKLPFSIYLKDFELKRYPGSDSPSSFSSEVEIRDKETVASHNIFMNNVLDYKGYRFFQSAYPPDESGTILSVNHDYWGTLVTYIGYFFMALGMLMSLVWKGSYFRIVLKQSSGV